MFTTSFGSSPCYRTAFPVPSSRLPPVFSARGLICLSAACLAALKCSPAASDSDTSSPLDSLLSVPRRHASFPKLNLLPSRKAAPTPKAPLLDPFPYHTAPRRHTPSFTPTPPPGRLATHRRSISSHSMSHRVSSAPILSRAINASSFSSIISVSLLLHVDVH